MPPNTDPAPKRPWRKTPLTESTALSKAANCRIFLKLENTQPSGSFKSRGIGNYCATALRTAKNPSKVHFYSSSGGNAGIACVHAANFLGRPSTVVVPFSTKDMVIGQMKAAGASEVLQHGANWREADTYLRDVVMRDAEKHDAEAVYVNPFDHPDVWAGHQTMIDEIAAQMAEMGEDAPEVVACSVGGGGLLTGLLQGVEAQGEAWKNTMMLAVETKGADSLAQSLDAGELVTLPGITSQATTLGAVRVAERVFELASKHQAMGRFKYGVLGDEEAMDGSLRLADEERILVELACGVTVALCWDGRLARVLGRTPKKDDKVVVVVCGGTNITTGMIEQWRQGNFSK